MINVNADLASVKSRNFITTDTGGSSNHTNIVITNSTFSNYTGIFLNTAKSSVADSIIIKANSFSKNKSTLFNFMNETDKKGYYNVEKLTISNNKITGQQGQVLGMLRGGNDESTMGPIVYFTGNTVSNSQSAKPLIHFYGTQYSTITGNSFINANAGATLIKYEDVVKALHLFSHNTISISGKVEPDQFTVIEDVEEKN
jgi:poly(beta-D-mannuronate) lyase